MHRNILVGASALFLVACSGAGKAPEPAGTPAMAAATDAKAVFELGRPV